MIARQLRHYGYIDRALDLVRQAAIRRPTAGIFLEWGNLYAEKFVPDSMMNAYVKAVESNPAYVSYIQSVLTKYIDDKPDNPYARALIGTLVKRIAARPDPVYFRMLMWVYTRQRNYAKAFVQARGLYLRGQMRPGELFGLARAALDDGDRETVRKVLRLLDERSGEMPPVLAEQALVMKARLVWDPPPANDSLAYWKNVWLTRVHRMKFQAMRFEILKMIEESLIHRRRYAEALHLADSLQKTPAPVKQKAYWREREGDILLRQKHFARAAIVYTLLREDFQYDEINYRALYKMALASFFDGDPEWAHQNLRTLKKAASRDIANDALLLDFMIISNRDRNDSLQNGLKQLARAYFRYYTGQTDELNRLADSLHRVRTYPKIDDDLYYLQAQSALQAGRWKQALTYWQTLLAQTREKMFREEALYRIGIIFEKLGQPEKAAEYFKQVLKDYPMGFYFDQAQAHYRKLTGK